VNNRAHRAFFQRRLYILMAVKAFTGNGDKQVTGIDRA